MMYSTRPEHVAILGPKGSMKLNLGPGLDRDTWDSIFGSGAWDATHEKGQPITAEEAWKFQGWYRKAADVRGKAVSTLPWAIYGDGEDPLWRDTDDSIPDGLEVLDGIDGAFYLAETALALCGRFYFGKVLTSPGERLGDMGRLEHLQWWSPLTVKPKVESGRAYFVRSVGGRQINVPVESVLWGWQPDPFVEWGPGSADGGAGVMGASVLNSMNSFLRHHLDSGLVKMTVLSIEGHSDPEQRSELRKLWARLLRRGADREGPPVLNGVVKPHTIGEGLKDLSETELTKEQREAISTTFGIPWSVLTSESANYATAQVEERGFYIRTVIPQAKIVERAFNTRLFKEYGLQLKFEPERHEIMQQFELEKAEKLALLIGKVYTREEARDIMGLNPEPELGSFEETPMPSGDGQASNVEALSLSAKLDHIIGKPEAR